jgi:hypothetical protein
MVNIKLHTLDVQYFTYHLFGRKPSTNCIVLHLEKLSLGMISTFVIASENLKPTKMTRALQLGIKVHDIVF